MNRVLVSIGSINIYWYSVIMLVAILIGIFIAIRYSRRINMPSMLISDMVLGLVISAVIGARVYYVIFNFAAYRENIIDIFKIWEGGLAIYGAVIGGIFYILYYSKKKGVSFIRLLDVCSLSLLLGQAIGRWGNFFNQEAFGGITTRSFLKSIYIPDFIINNMYIDGAYRIPTFLYESIWCLIGVLILLYIRRYKSNIIGRQLFFYMIWYGIGRFVIEGMRSDSLYIGDFRVSQIVSIIMVAIGIIGYIGHYFKTHLKIKKDIGGINGRI